MLALASIAALLAVSSAWIIPSHNAALLARPSLYGRCVPSLLGLAQQRRSSGECRLPLGTAGASNGGRSRMMLAILRSEERSRSEGGDNDWDDDDDDEEEEEQQQVLAPKTMEPLSDDARRVAAVAGTPEAIDVLRELYLANRKLDAETLAQSWGFAIDDFQLDSVRAIVDQRSVIVSAPTGSGKTLCGEAAIYAGLALGKRVLYTTPLKALSNQKFYDFKKQFGEERVGLLTGDVSVNRDKASVLVLTTEVYRNMLYDKDAEAVRDVHSVILDEFHYMNDKDRGTVWEESVIQSPKGVLLVALSATMRNVNDIKAWFEHVHGPTDLITSDFRPVPLKFKFADRQGIVDLFDVTKNRKGEPRINRRLLPGAVEEYSRGGAQGGKERGNKRSYESGRTKRRRRGREEDKTESRQQEGEGGGSSSKGGFGGFGAKDEKRGGGGGGGGMERAGRGRQEGRGGNDVPSYGFVVRQLKKKDMLPAIFFIFSRAGCDAAAMDIAKEKTPLVNEEEKERLKQKLSEFCARHREVAAEDRVRLALRGIASHHAGLLPVWKNLVEECFQEGLIKVRNSRP